MLRENTLDAYLQADSLLNQNAIDAFADGDFFGSRRARIDASIPLWTSEVERLLQELGRQIARATRRLRDLGPGLNAEYCYTINALCNAGTRTLAA